MMRAARVVHAVATVVRLWSFAFLVPIPVAFVFEPRDLLVGPILVPFNAAVFFVSFVAATAVWVPLRFLGRRAEEQDLAEREGYLAVALGWLVLTGLGMLPFVLSGTLRAPADALLESMSGLTTTGLTAIADVDGTDKSILFWRALMQWIGGLGIIVLMVALLFKLTHGGSQLFRAESGGHATRIRPKLRQTAQTLWLMYVGITGAVAVALFAIFRWHIGLDTRLAAFEAVCHAMTAYATGGFSTRTASIAAFDSALLEGVLAVVMVAGATNFTLVFFLVRRRQWRPLVRSAEWRFFIGVLAAMVTAVVLLLVAHGSSWGEAARTGLFNVVSLVTTTGYGSADYAAWTVPALLLLLLASLIGGMAGSTSGAMKTVRWLVLLKLVGRELRRLVHPRAVIPIRIGDRIIKEETVNTVVAFFFTYLFAWTAAAILLAALEPRLGVLDAVSITASSIGNVGPGLGVFGPFGTGVFELSSAGKVVLTSLMWFGRLEIFTALIVFMPSSWRN